MVFNKFLERQKRRLLKRREKYLNFRRTIISDRLLALSADEYRLRKINRILPKIEAAVEKIEAGQYGVCLDCGDKISRRRLLAVPGALRCLPCQEANEKKGGKNEK